MMLKLSDIQEYIAHMDITQNVYIGRLDNKKEKSIGVYPRKREGPPVTALGGEQYSSYDIRPVSLLIHWNKDKEETEKAAFGLFEKIRNGTRTTIGSMQIPFIRLMVPEPQDVGTDDNGIYEYVIWLDFIYCKEV